MSIVNSVFRSYLSVFFPQLPLHCCFLVDSIILLYMAFGLFPIFCYYEQGLLFNFFVQFFLCVCCVSCSWQHTQEDLQLLRSDLDAVSMKCSSFLHQSPSGSSVPTLRSELSLLVEKMEHVYGLSTVYLNKWVSWEFGSRGQYFRFRWKKKCLECFMNSSGRVHP